MKTNRKRIVEICLSFQPREDGGVRVFSDDLPGFVLSHRDYQLVMSDVAPALETMLGVKYGAKVEVLELEKVREDLEDCGIISPYPVTESHKKYAAVVEGPCLV